MPVSKIDSPYKIVFSSNIEQILIISNSEFSCESFIKFAIVNGSRSRFFSEWEGVQPVRAKPKLMNSKDVKPLSLVTCKV